MKDINNFKTLEEVETYRKLVNEECDKRIEKLNQINKSITLSDSSFGFIKETFENLSPILFESEEGRTIINKYIKEIKSNKELSSLYGIYENIRKADKNTDVDFLVNYIINEKVTHNKEKINKSTQKLGHILAEAFLFVGKDANDLIPEEKHELDNAIEFIAENRIGMNNVVKFSSAIGIIKEEVNKHEISENQFKNKNLDSMISNMVREYNEKYSDLLNENEKNAIKLIGEAKNKEELFNTYKNNCINKFNEQIQVFKENNDKESVSRLENIAKQVENKKYNLDTLTEDIIKLTELMTIFQ